MLDIIITAYHCHDKIERAIGSVLMQRNHSDIMITIVDDADEKPYDYLLAKYAPIFGERIRLLRKPTNTGCGQTRQFGIDHTECDYVTFLDADDCFYSPFSTEILYNSIVGGGFDIVSSAFAEELPDGKIIMHENERTWMHGKIYRTEFLRYHEIRFNMARSNEDSAFNVLCYALCDGEKHIDFCTYMWINNSASLTRNGDWLTDTVSVYVDNGLYACAELAKRKYSPLKLAGNIFSYLCTMYGYYCVFLHNGMDGEYLAKYADAIRRFRRGVNADKLIPLISAADKAEIYKNNGIVRNIGETVGFLPISMNEFFNITNK